MTWRLSRRADADIVGIYVEGATVFGARQAEEYADGLFRTLDLLDANPRLARERLEFTPAIRVHPYGSHLVIYLIDNSGVLVLRIVPGRSDWERLFV